MVHPETGNPAHYILEQNYPNPFNPATVISYQLGQDSFVTLEVYDILGREVATLVKGKETAGIHPVEFNASRLASGIYFYRIEAGPNIGQERNFTETKKMVLIR